MKRFQPINSSRNANLEDCENEVAKSLGKYKEYT